MDKGKLLNYLYNMQLSMRATLVINYLINRSNKELTCFPAIKTIAKDCNISTRTVQRALKDLLATGVIKKENRYRENGGQSSNLYTLMLDEENAKKEKLEVKEEIKKIDEAISNETIAMDTVDFNEYKSLESEEDITLNEEVDETDTHEDDETMQEQIKNGSKKIVTKQYKEKIKALKIRGTSNRRKENGEKTKKSLIRGTCQGEYDNLVPP